jgi:pimeloyl-ACP methyl ester carboxylesterase
MQIALVLARFLVLLIVILSTSQARGADCLQGPGYVNGFDANRPSVVVFVHGVLSGSATAWNSGPPDQVVWPCFIKSDLEFFGDTNLYVHEYPADLSDSPSIDEVANRLYRDLLNSGHLARGVFGHRHVTFVAHSMGGLVVTRMLMGADFQPNDLERVRLLMLYGTPGNGAGLAKVATYFSSARQFAELSNSQDLSSWTHRFNRVAWPFHRVCLAEGADVGALAGTLFSWLNPFSVRVVPRESAAALCEGKSIELAGLDHMAIVKPTPRHMEPHRQLRLQYGDCIKPLLPPNVASLNPPDAAMNAAARWLEELRLNLESPPAGMDRITVLKLRLDPTAYSYPMPADVEHPSFSTLDYKRWPGTAFANETDAFLRQFPLADAAIEWVSTARGARARLADQAFADLLQSPGISVETDLVIALRSKRAPLQGKALLLVREGPESTGPAPSPGQWLRGLLWVPTPGNECGRSGGTAGQQAHR